MKGMNNYVKVGLLVLAIVAIGYLVKMYRKRNTEGFEDVPAESGSLEMPSMEQCADDKFLNEPSNRQKCDMMLAMKEKDTKTAEKVTEGFMVNGDGYAVMPSEELGRNETFKRLDEMGGAGGEFGLGGNMYPKDCFPKDQLTPAELLPGDANSKWAQSVPANPGELGDQNFLAAGFHIGINTVGQTLRNANRQLRSEPPNPQVKVSPWLQSTIEPDTNRRPLEIGGGCQ
jgi:hypothetical protein